MTTPTLPSKRSSSFTTLYAKLPQTVQREADEAYSHFKANPNHPGLNFRHITGPYYSARVGRNYRALALRRQGYWLGSGLALTVSTIGF